MVFFFDKTKLVPPKQFSSDISKINVGKHSLRVCIIIIYFYLLFMF